ncbi:MAG: outer membrane lipoprotein carrier protein LolA [bacterium]|nr:outer membrane lipoprotein carrier protein LolA [bacterium]
MANRLHLPALAILVLLVPLALAAQDPPPDPNAEGLTTSERFAALIERIKYEQGKLRTLEARFVQRKESLLLIEPEESQGNFSYRTPDQARWEFTSPNDILVVIRENEMLTWYRDLGRAERVHVGRRADRIMQFLGASNSLETLQRYFTVQVTFPRDLTRPYHLELDPRFDRVARRLKSMTIELDRTRYVPVYLRYVEPDGDTTEFRFEDYRINIDLPEDHFEAELPDDVEVRTVDLGSDGS